MNKTDFINAMVDQGCSKHTSSKALTKADAEKALCWVTESILGALQRGETVNLIGFGTFGAQRREAREGRNPKTGEKMHIPAYNQPIFRAGSKMKEACN